MRCSLGESALGVDGPLAATLASIGAVVGLIQGVAGLARIDEALAGLASNALSTLDRGCGEQRRDQQACPEARLGAAVNSLQSSPLPLEAQPPHD